MTGVPIGAQLKSCSASGVFILTQPWDIGWPKLLCQYVPWKEKPRYQGIWLLPKNMTQGTLGR